MRSKSIKNISIFSVVQHLVVNGLRVTGVKAKEKEKKMKEKGVKSISTINVGLLLHRHRILDFYDRRISKIGRKT